MADDVGFIIFKRNNGRIWDVWFHDKKTMEPFTMVTINHDTKELTGPHKEWVDFVAKVIIQKG
jgi:hypothetical protein